jgi:hypothetical protein
MPIKYDDEKSYRFHKSDSADRCFACNENSDRLLIVRQIKSMMLVHLCPNCIANNFSDYLLDNTRPWLGEKGNI